MAGSLEFAKLVAATYLKQMWDEIKGFNKWYLTIAVGILMMITSAGIFGYLSNAFQLHFNKTFYLGVKDFFIRVT